jgi:hypothetical protein
MVDRPCCFVVNVKVHGKALLRISRMVSQSPVTAAAAIVVVAAAATPKGALLPPISEAMEFDDPLRDKAPFPITVVT